MKRSSEFQTRKLPQNITGKADDFVDSNTTGKTVAIIQARLGSSRLPRKILLDIAGQSMLERVVTRVQQAKQIDQVVIATTTDQTDDPLIEYCEDRNWNFFRGSEHDVLSRYLETARHFLATRVVRVTSDCPLIAPGVIDQLVHLSIASSAGSGSGCKSELDYCCNFYPERHFPRGLDCECISTQALKRIDRLATLPEYREHVTLYAYRNPERFSIGSLKSSSDFSGFRWTVDTPEDLELIRTIYHHFESLGVYQFDWKQTIAACQANPHWQEINQLVVQKVA